MAKCVLTLFYCVVIYVLSLNFASGRWNTQDYLKREHSLVKPYQGSGTMIMNWDFAGSTLITNNYVRLTPDQQSKIGALWNNVPCYVQNWEMHVQFKVHGKGKDLFGDGFAIWYARDPLQQGSVFGNQENFHGLGIFLDTYANQNGPHNHGHPYISAMVNNGTLKYDHDRDGTHTELAGCEGKFRGVDHDTYISIRYEKDTLLVSTDIEGKSAWKECFMVKGVRLPTGYFFGVTAVTGDLTDTHDIISVKVYQLEVQEDQTQEKEDRSRIVPQASYFSPPRDHVEDPPPPVSGFKFFLIVLCALVGLAVCVVVGIIVFQKKQETSRKRFY